MSAVLLVASASIGWADQLGDPMDPLRRGGVTLYVRHALSDWSEEPTELAALSVKQADLKDCRGQRKLSDEGRAQARALGLAIRGLRLEIAEAWAAGLCRTIETARLAFGEPKIVPELSPRLGQYASLGLQSSALERIIRAPLNQHALRIVIGDYELAQALFGITLAEGDAVVLRPGSSKGIEALGRIRASDWRLFAPVATSARVTGSSGPSNPRF